MRSDERARGPWPLLAVLTAAYGAGAFGILGVTPLSPFLLTAFQLTRVEVGLLLPAAYESGMAFTLAGRQRSSSTTSSSLPTRPCARS